MVVSIVGSRTLCDNGKSLFGYPADYKPVDGVRFVEHAVRKSGFDVTKVLSGGAGGIDSAAIAWAKMRGIPYEVYPARWKEYGKRAGIIRNHEMTLHEEACIAIYDGTSRGTANKMACSVAAAHPVYVLRVKTS